MRRLTEEPALGSVIQVQGFFKLEDGNPQLGQNSWSSSLLVRTDRGWEGGIHGPLSQVRTWAELVDDSDARIEHIDIWLIAVAESAASEQDETDDHFVSTSVISPRARTGASSTSVWRRG